MKYVIFHYQGIELPALLHDALPHDLKGCVPTSAGFTDGTSATGGSVSLGIDSHPGDMDILKPLFRSCQNSETGGVVSPTAEVSQLPGAGAPPAPGTARQWLYDGAAIAALMASIFVIFKTIL